MSQLAFGDVFAINVALVPASTGLVTDMISSEAETEIVGVREGGTVRDGVNVNDGVVVRDGTTEGVKEAVGSNGFVDVGMVVEVGA